MSGGSYDYLYLRQVGQADPETVDRMCERLKGLGLQDAAEQVRRYFGGPPDLSKELRSLLRTIEYRDSGDSGQEKLEAAVEAFIKGEKDERGG